MQSLAVRNLGAQFLALQKLTVRGLALRSLAAETPMSRGLFAVPQPLLDSGRKLPAAAGASALLSHERNVCCADA